jgi:hypothetical protein
VLAAKLAIWTEFWYSVTPFTLTGLPAAVAATECAAQFPAVPYITTPVFFELVAQVTRTDDEVTSVRYGALVSRELAPGRLARAADGLARSATTARTANPAAVPRMRDDPYR